MALTDPFYKLLNQRPWSINDTQTPVSIKVVGYIRVGVVVGPHYKVGSIKPEAGAKSLVSIDTNGKIGLSQAANVSISTPKSSIEVAKAETGINRQTQEIVETVVTTPTLSKVKGGSSSIKSSGELGIGGSMSPWGGLYGEIGVSVSFEYSY